MKRTGGHEQSEEAHAALSACDHAIAARQFAEAERQLDQAKHLGASPAVLKRHREALDSARASTSARNARAVWLGFLVAAVGYFALSAQQPAGWGVGLWAVLALLLVPALTGLTVSRFQTWARPPREAFFAAMKAVGWAMLFYATITLTVLAHRVDGPNGGERFLAGALVTLVYILVAGAAAGTVNLMLTRAATRKGSHGPSS